MNVPPAGKASRGRFRHRRYGVYDVMYEDTTTPFSLRMYSVFDKLRAVHTKMRSVRRFLADTLKLAPAAFIAYMVVTIWRGVSGAVKLYWLNILLDSLGASMMKGTPSPGVYRSLATSWLWCAMINVPVGHIYARSREILTEQFAAYFTPQLISASLRVGLFSIQDVNSVVPGQGRFISEFPDNRFLGELSRLIQCTLNLVSRMFVLVHVISSKRSPEREILTCFCLGRELVRWLAPSSGVGSSAYVFWPSNQHFMKMKTLFGFAFSIGYRADILLDGMASSIETEYAKAAERLGSVGVSEPMPWRADLRRDWYWDFLLDIFDNPLAVSALFSAYLPPSSIISMVLLQQTARSVSVSMGEYALETPSLLEVCSHAEWLYDAIDYKSTIPQGTEPLPRPMDDAGMKISFRHVSLRYPKSDHDALHNVSFDILPGELVLIVGTNGSGKSSVLKLLARLFDPTAGEILIDDAPVVRFDANQLRAAMAFQAQTPVVYPGSVRDNITFGLPPACDADAAHVEAAAQASGCAEWIARLGDGYDAQLWPSFDINNGWMEGIFGSPSKALSEALAQHKGTEGRVSISGGEKQRLATARTFMRLNMRTTRLVVADEATSALDPVAERTVLNTLREARAGKTVVLVTHRFHHLAHDADRILCMSDGHVVESGTHVELMRANGNYAALYDAQVGRVA